MSLAQSREFQLSQIRKLQHELESATPGRCKEIEAEIATRTQDIRNLEVLLKQQQEPTKHDAPKVKEYSREVPQQGEGIGGSRKPQ
jgi:hypothetical protein